MTSYVRGATIHFAVTFTDAVGAPYTPSAPVLVIDYPMAKGARASETINLTSSAGAWVGDWDSGVADRGGTVLWASYSSAPDPKIASQGSFTLDANAANLEAV